MTTNQHTEQSERAELKPCPFCGGAPKTTARPDNIDGTGFFFAVACYCGGYSSCAHKMAVRKTPEQAKRDAIEAWNTRALLAADKAGGEPVAWMHWLHGPVQLFMNKDDAMLELERLNREYPVDESARKMRPLVFGDIRPQQASDKVEVDHIGWKEGYAVGLRAGKGM